MSDDRHASILIRPAVPEDVPRLNRLAALDSRRAPHGPMLLAETGGELQAAVALDGSEAIADPWRSTAGLLVLLRLRAAQMTAERVEAGDAALRRSRRAGRTPRRSPARA